MANDRQELQELEELDSLESKASGKAAPSLQTPQNTAITAVNPPISKPETPGFMQSVGQDVSQRVQQAQDIKGRAGAQPIGETALQAVGGVGAGLMGDVTGEATKSAYGALPENIRKNIEADPITKMGVRMAQKGADIYGKWAQQNPRAAKDVEAAVNIASLFPGPSAKLAGKAVETAASPVTGIVKGAIAPSEAKMATITDTMHKQATATIEKVKNSGINFAPNDTQQLMDKFNKHPDLQTAGEVSVRPETTKTLADMKKSIEAGDNSIRNFLGFRDKLTEIVNRGGQDGEAARKARKTLDSMLDTGSSLPKEFRGQWSRYKTGETVAEAAKLADVSSAKSRAAFQKIVDSKYFGSLSPEVQRLTKIAAQGKKSGKFMDVIGKLTYLMGGSIPKVGKVLPGLELGGALLTGNIPAVATIGGVMAGEKAGKLVQRGAGADVLKALQKEQNVVKPEAEMAATAKKSEPLRLTYQGRKAAAEARKAKEDAIAGRAEGPRVHGEAPTEQKLLPGPSSPGREFVGTTPRRATMGEEGAMSAKRTKEAESGFIPGTRKAIFIKQLREKTGPVFDRLAKKQQNKVAEDIAKHYAENPGTPLKTLIDQARRAMQYLAAAKGETFSDTEISAAMRRAREGK